MFHRRRLDMSRKLGTFQTFCVVDSGECLSWHAKPASKYERARLGIFAFLGTKISYSSEAGFCLCERRFTTAHRACPKIPVDCASECRLA